MKKIPIGVENFKEIISNDFYYIDKTKSIEDILNDGSKVKLFTRPRRFGKTLNISTLKYFFDIQNADENRKLFNGLDIEKSEYFSEQGKHPVIFISMKGIKAITWKDYLYDLKILIGDLYNEFEFIRDVLNESELNSFNKIWLKEDVAEYKNALKNLTAFLYKYYKKEVILLIDEYDNPLITAHRYDFYDEALSFFKVFYGEALKTNPYLKMGIMTGIIRVIKAGIFSDLNNLRVYSILNEQYSDFFGFTQNEVENALKDFNIEYELPDVKAWYDGYKFGNSDVYNPWSILNFLTDKKLIPYWIDTSDNYLINKTLKNASSDTMEALQKLFSGESVEENINGNSDLSILFDEEEIWELFLFSGYLTIDEKIGEDYENVYALRLPNREVKEFFKQKFIDMNFGESLFRNIMEALKKNNIDNFEKYLQNIILKSASYYDGKNEDFYHGLILGMTLYLDRDYYVNSNRESGLGRYDVIIEPKNKNNRGYILEFKVVKDEKDLEKSSKEAIEQIIDKKYDTSLKERGIKDITLIGITFFGKIIKVNYQ
ncbi:AAA family ATPase [Fusobacterium nucleatum]|uniref:AAA family ATPase n=1 Tax=Fusobacterium nucleatum TaxID=851 RepID=UPI0023613311|nr:AAA family ATPase [Fusobacterium nucleatum]WDD89537.1 AAA family ATPase [Fusobacterium nucleatum]